MDRYIGLDAHGTSCTFAVVGPSGRKLRSDVVEPGGAALVQYVRGIAGQRHLCLEEGTHASWLYELPSPHVQENVVAHIRTSRGQKSDAIDAFMRAEELRTGAVRTRVFKAPREFGRLRELVRVHSMLVRDVVRVQLRIKAMYRARGVATPGDSVYRSKQREQWVRRLQGEEQVGRRQAPRAVRRGAEAEEGGREGAHRRGREAPHLRDPADGPGDGPDSSGAAAADGGDAPPLPNAQAVLVILRSGPGDALVVGLGENARGRLGPRQRSDEPRTEPQPQPRAEDLGARRRRSTRRQARPQGRPLWTGAGNIFKGAATTVIANLPSEPLHEHYQSLTEAGTKPNLAKLTLARKIAAIVLRMWQNEEAYSPTRYRPQGTDIDAS